MVGRQIIFQFDDVNKELLDVAKANGVDAVPLFDISGGDSSLAGGWPKPTGKVSGYARGLSPDNIEEQIAKINDVTGDAEIWIDLETHVRSNNDALFDLDKVNKFLSIISPYVTT